jgi:hypothetical protein
VVATRQLLKNKAHLGRRLAVFDDPVWQPGDPPGCANSTMGLTQAPWIDDAKGYPQDYQKDRRRTADRP